MKDFSLFPMNEFPFPMNRCFPPCPYSLTHGAENKLWHKSGESYVLLGRG